MDSINDNAVSPVSREPAEWNSKDHVAYNANFAAHRPGISHNEVVQAYNDWAARGEYEEVRYRTTIVVFSLHVPVCHNNYSRATQYKLSFVRYPFTLGRDGSHVR